MSDTETSTEALEKALTEWAHDRSSLNDRRDRLVRSARAAGISKHRIHVLSGIARTTIDDILAVKMTPVTELYVRCSYPMRSDAIAASDTCQHPANTAVRDFKGWLFWRCPTHEGELTNGV